MGLLGSAGIRLRDSGPSAARLRDHAVRCATPVESLLRLNEWDPWLTDAHIDELSGKVRDAVIGRGYDIPFAKVVKAFLGAPDKTRKRVLQPLLAPLLRHFGATVARLLPPPGPIAFVMPINVIHLLSFLLYAVMAAAAPSRLVLVKKKGVTIATDFGLEDVIPHLADDRPALERWLLGELGGASTIYEYTYDMRALAKALDNIDPASPTVLDLPFVDSMEILGALLPRERVFNLNSAFGAPGEICVAYEYYMQFGVATERCSSTRSARAAARSRGGAARLSSVARPEPPGCMRSYSRSIGSIRSRTSIHGVRPRSSPGMIPRSRRLRITQTMTRGGGGSWRTC
jgi:hypothetical protein